MNKLISRNPIQRFKQGRKIIKAQWGLRTRDDGVIVNAAGTPIGRSIRHSSYEYEKTFPNDKLILPGLYQDPDDGAIYSPNGGYKKVLSGPSPIENGTYYETKDTSGKVIEKGRYFGGKKHPLPLGKIVSESSQNQEKQTIETNKKQNTTLQQRPSSKISFKQAFNKARNSKLQEFTWNGKKYNTMKAGETKEQWLANIKSKQTGSPKININPEQVEKDRQTIINQALSKPVLSTIPEEGISNFIPLSTTKTYNRANVRDFIRSKGRGAYDFSGSQRKALRMVLNGQGIDKDKAIVQGMNLFKQGGQLPSRNIVERFKLKINK